MKKKLIACAILLIFVLYMIIWIYLFKFGFWIADLIFDLEILIWILGLAIGIFYNIMLLDIFKAIIQTIYEKIEDKK